ncbi:hypothetical protein CROQUDRAFT_655488 [Cronartium quercuum f. sp. fusiforme G11]|uniref:Uncharacterized protein n=1 Tax=Cronartium quercuum f. sp. fusiforme G11 TaxID=708437 RepID=A0A9P6TD17_9BASI|nr:hypothetical protein CROQUDRAFT_655488 [Cronartium quercuum f. sp. fusiforme G11]
MIQTNSKFSLNELIELIRLKWSKVQSRVCGLRSCVGCGCCVWVWVARGSLVSDFDASLTSEALIGHECETPGQIT